MAQRPIPIQEFLSIGPFGGVDPTTPPFYVAPTNFVAMSNVLPANQQYGGYVTVPGRMEALLAKLPSVPTGIGQIQQANAPTIYLFACEVGGVGAIYYATLDGTPVQLALPEPLTPGQLTYFVSSRKWVFVTNGVDTPIKISTDLVATYWGIVAPTTAPQAVTSGIGPLVGTYYYCETFSNADQESSQGVISAPVVATGTSATQTLVIGGVPAAGDVVTYILDGIPVQVVVSAGQTPQEVAIALAGQINTSSNLNTLVQASVSNSNVILTTIGKGSAQNALVGFGAVSSGAGTTIAPNAPTPFAGGTDGNSITITPTATTTDPQVTTRNFYRIGGSLGTWALVHSQPIDDLTPFLDVTADADVTGQPLVVFRDPPPPFKAIMNYQDRIFGFGTPSDPTLVQWSNYNEPWGFNPDTNALEAGPNDFDDVAQTCGSIGSMGLLLKTRSLYAVVGNSDTTFTVVPIAPVGCIAPASLAIGEGVATWEALRGTQLFNGYTLQTISDTGYQQSNVKAIRAAYAPSDLAQAVGFYFDRLFCMSYPSKNTTLCWDIRSQQWFPLGFALGAVLYDPESTTPVIGANLQNPGQVDQWFASTANGDLGAPIAASITSRITDAGALQMTKLLRYVLIEAPVQDGTISVYVYANPGPGQILVAQEIGLSQSGTPRTRWELPAGLEGQEVQLQLQTNALEQVVLHKVSLYGQLDRPFGASSPTDG